MANNAAETKQRLHQLVDDLPPEQTQAALKYLNYLAADPMLLALLSAPPDDEAYTEDQRRQEARSI